MSPTRFRQDLLVVKARDLRYLSDAGASGAQPLPSGSNLPTGEALLVPGPVRNCAAWRRRAFVGWCALVLASGTLRAADPPAARPEAAPDPGGGEWKSLFDGKSLAGWQVTNFGGHGEVEVKSGQLILPMGAMLTGVSYTNSTPKMNYEVSLEAMRVEGSDFFCGLTFPVRDSFLTFVVGGWGGGIVGISSLDNYDASENETTKYLSFEKNRWYKIRLRVTPKKLEAWIDDNRVVNVSIEGRKLSLRPGEIELSKPFGVATYQTTAALRNLRLRPVTADVR